MEDKFVWFTSGNNVIGVGRMVDKVTSEVKYYINAVDGFSKAMDEVRVMEWGATFPKAAGDALFGTTSNAYEDRAERRAFILEDRSGGAFTCEEIARSERGGEGW